METQHNEKMFGVEKGKNRVLPKKKNEWNNKRKILADGGGSRSQQRKTKKKMRIDQGYQKGSLREGHGHIALYSEEPSREGGCLSKKEGRLSPTRNRDQHNKRMKEKNRRENQS